MIMKYLIFLITLISCNSHNINPKLCINCKNFIGDYIGNKYGKCKAFPIISQKDDEYLVTGKIKKVETVYTYCSISRQNKNMCGEIGLKFEKK